MKSIFYTLLLAGLPFQAIQAQSESAVDAVKNMGVGWNLGNTLDAYSRKGKPTDASYWNCQGLDSETYWGQPTTTSKFITMMKNAGFGAIRVPVTWFNHMDKDGKVNAAWMKRVHEVVDYVIDNGLYCILNVHHDTGADSGTSESWIKASEDNYTTYQTRYEELWKQIAEEFKSYGDQLIFEGYNEMLDTKNSWSFADSKNSTYSSAAATSAYNGLNNYAQSFVNAVRATGGNNADRNLIVNTYAAACGTGSWNTHLQDPLKNMKLPEDEATGHLIYEVHAYPNLTYTSATGATNNRSMTSIKSEVDELISNSKNYLKGAPLIIGEWGTANVDAGDGKTDYDLRKDLMFKFVDYFVQQTKANNIATFYWMGLSDGMYRKECAFNQPDLAQRIAKAYHGSSFTGEYPTLEDISEYVCFEGEKVLGWGDGITIPANMFKNAGEKCQLELTYSLTSSNNALQFYYGDWSEKSSVILNSNSKTYAGDVNPGSIYGYISGKECTSVFTFPKTNYDVVSTKGLVIHGTGITLKKAVVKNPDAASGIAPTIAKTPTKPEAIYNLSGQRVENPKQGIYIVNGRKTIFK